MLLKWDPAKYDGITEINVDVNLIWIPHIELFNKYVKKHETLHPLQVFLSVHIRLEFCGTSRRLMHVTKLLQ